MRAGAYKERVTIRAAVDVDDGHFGTTVTEPVIAARIPARVRQLLGRALERAQMVDARSTHEVEIRKRTGLAVGQTVIYHDQDGDRSLEIVAPPLDIGERNLDLRLLCREQEVRA